MADETKLTAATRLEKLLDNIAGGENEVTPATRLEKFLSYIADAMEGGGGSGGGGCECKTLIITVDATDPENPVYTPNLDYSDMPDITGILVKMGATGALYTAWTVNQDSYYLTPGAPGYPALYFNSDNTIVEEIG